jgi:hypothetical protein
MGEDLVQESASRFGEDVTSRVELVRTVSSILW